MRRKALVLLPGTLCTAELFAQQVERCAPLASVQVIPLTQGPTVSACAAWVLSQVPSTFALAGFSQGAVVALEIMRQAPERVTRLALMAANPRGTTPAQVEVWGELIRQAREEGVQPIVSRYYEAVDPASRTPELRQVLEAMASKTGTETFVTQLTMLASRSDSRPYLSQIPCPTLVVAGETDPLTPVVLHEELAAGISRATLHVLGRCGHYSPLERPQELAELLESWLAV